MSLASTLGFLKRNATTTASSSTSSSNPPPLHIAVEGCSHGELDKIYEECVRHESETNKKIDVLICCGDFQSVRSGAEFQKIDLESMHVPKKYLSTGDFPKYFSGEKKAPILTIVIGGNHECSNFLFECYYGGFLCENIYHLGHSGVINVGGLRIAGLSGIFKFHDFLRPYPVPPYHGDESKIRAAYHVRKFEIDKLMRLASSSSSSTSNNNNNIDIFISHDWPIGITDFGDTEDLLRKKPYFKEDLENKQLGNPHTMALLKSLKPRYWFAAHLHVRFKALFHHENQINNNTNNNNNIGQVTEFLALDKCVRHTNEFLHFMDIIPAASSFSSMSGQQTQNQLQQQPLRDPFNENKLIIYHDPQWVEIIRQNHLRTPLDLSGGIFEEENSSSKNSGNVAWIHESILPLLEGKIRMPNQSNSGNTNNNRGERRERTNENEVTNTEQQQQQKSVPMIQASSTLELLKAMGLTASGENNFNASEHVRRPQYATTSQSAVVVQSGEETASQSNTGDVHHSVIDCLGWSEDV